MTILKSSLLILFVNIAVSSPLPRINETWFNLNDFEVIFEENSFKVNIKNNNIYNVWKVEQIDPATLLLKGWYNKSIDYTLLLPLVAPTGSFGGVGGGFAHGGAAGVGGAAGGAGLEPPTSQLSGCALKACVG